jgi:hypothetical protein
LGLLRPGKSAARNDMRKRTHMSELKSAWEIAQERASRLGKLSAEEKERQELQAYRQIGHALAQKWLDNPHLDMAAELNRHEEKGRPTIRRAAIEHLADAIDFTTAQGMNSLQGIIEGLVNLGPELQPRAQEVGQLAREYEAAEEKIRQELESSYRETLHRLRISGTAVGAINLETNPQWQSARQGLVEGFASRLNNLKQALAS